MEYIQLTVHIVEHLNSTSLQSEGKTTYAYLCSSKNCILFKHTRMIVNTCLDYMRMRTWCIACTQVRACPHTQVRGCPHTPFKHTQHYTHTQLHIQYIIPYHVPTLLGDEPLQVPYTQQFHNNCMFCYPTTTLHELIYIYIPAHYLVQHQFLAEPKVS